MVKRKNLIWAAVFAAVIAACMIFIFLTGGKSGENSAEIYENGRLIKTVMKSINEMLEEYVW